MVPSRFVRWIRGGLAPCVLFCAVSGCEEDVDPTGGALDRILGPSRDAVPAEIDQTYDAFIDACRRADAPSAWSVLGPELRDQLDAQARTVASGASAKELEKHYGHAGHKAGFDGTALLAALLATDDARDPCRGAELWRRIEAGQAYAGGYYVVAERPDGAQQGLRIALDDESQRWVIAELTQPVAVEHLEARGTQLRETEP